MRRFFIWIRGLLSSFLRSFRSIFVRNQTHQTPDDSVFRRPENVEARVLVLGAADTGKSTFMKQIRYKFGDEYPVDARRRFQPHIRQNLLESIHKIVTAVENFGITLASQEAQDAAQTFRDMENIKLWSRGESPLDPQLRSQINSLWADTGAQEAYRRGNEYHLLTNAEHFITSADRILHPAYLPTIDDILRMRYPTSDAVVRDYKLGNMTMILKDVGGHRTQRQDWMDQMRDPTAIIFFTSLSEYDQKVEEAQEENKNRVCESLDFFEALVSYTPYDSVPIFLLLNKKDVFQRKITQKSLKEYFSDYDGPEGDEVEGQKFITGLYETVAGSYGRQYVVRYTEATNTDNFMAFFAFIRNNISRDMMSRGGLF